MKLKFQVKPRVYRTTFPVMRVDLRTGERVQGPWGGDVWISQWYVNARHDESKHFDRWEDAIGYASSLCAARDQP
jgi:hypothetical protein